MCFSDDSRPPALPGVRYEAEASAVTLVSGDGEAVDAVEAMPIVPHSEVAVLVIHDGRGLHPYYAALARDLAELGHHAIAIDLYGRTAGPLPRGADFVSGEHSAQMRWRTVQLDLRAGADRLRQDASVRDIVVLGFCLGGRVALLAATVPELQLAGTVAFYAQTSGAARSDLPEPAALASELTCPGLSVFGESDVQISAGEVAAWRTAVAGSPYPHDVIVYPGVGHSFFDRTDIGSVDMRAVACADAARQTAEFLASVGHSAV